MKRIVIFLSLGCLCAALEGVETRSFIQSSYEDFIAGEFENVSLRNSGRLELAPSLDEVADLEEAIIWAVESDAEGNLYLGTGNYGKVLKVTPEGESSVLFAPEEVLCRALALDESGNLFVGTSPRGRVYRLAPGKRPEVYFDPPDNYIWSMTFDREGNLYIATGNKAVIYKLPREFQPEDEPIVWFESAQDHLTDLAWDKDGNLLAGSSPGGILYRVSGKGKGFALYNTGAQEIKQIVTDKRGTIYFSTFSTTFGPNLPGVNPIQPKGKEEDTFVVTAKRINGDAAKPPGKSLPPSGGPGSSMIYALDEKGFVEAWWGLPKAHIFSMAFNAAGELVVGSDDKGRIFSIRDRGNWRLLQTAPKGGEVSILYPERGDSGALLVFTSNPARIFRFRTQPAASGTYRSKALDAGQISNWGTIAPMSGNLEESVEKVRTRSGNTSPPDDTWSDWAAVDLEETGLRASSPVARYLQYEVELEGGEEPGDSFEIQQVRVFYQTHNIAPHVGSIRILPTGFQLLKMVPNAPNLELKKLIEEKDPGKLLKAPPVREQLKRMGEEGLMSILWKAFDPNGDKLEFALSIRRTGEREWIMLSEKLSHPFFTFNTNGFKEGYYEAKVTADDKPANAENPLRGDRVSDVFLIDNSPPGITLGEKTPGKGSFHLTFEARDAYSIQKAASYSLDGKPPQSIRPLDGLFDARAESFRLDLEDLDPGAHSLVLETLDENNRAGVLTVPFTLEE